MDKVIQERLQATVNEQFAEIDKHVLRLILLGYRVSQIRVECESTFDGGCIMLNSKVYALGQPQNAAEQGKGGE